jgi:hypothetical protein
MKLYLIVPNLMEQTSREALVLRHRACADAIVDLILSHISSDPALFGVRSKREVCESPIPTDLSFGEADAVHLPDMQVLRKVMADCADPYSGKFMEIRSLSTCRSVSFGYDGQAFVCLPTASETIISPNPALVIVKECSHYLSETDWIDGIKDD